MKKIAVIAALCLIGMIGHAQTSLISTNINALIKTQDTVTNTGSNTMLFPAGVKFTGPGQGVTVTTVNTPLTGTMKGVATLWGSLDGVEYNRIRSTALHGVQVDSLVLDAAHPNYAWIIDQNPFNYYEVVTTGIGTTTFTIQSLAIKH
jgi:hypothetical protein